MVYDIDEKKTMRLAENTWTTKVTKFQPMDGMIGQDRQRTRWRDEIGNFAGVTWGVLQWAQKLMLITVI